MKIKWSNLMGSTPNPANEVVLRIGRITFTRREMAIKLRITNYRAAIILTDILDELGITLVRQLYGTRIEDIRAKGAGTWTLCVACCLMAWKGYNYERWIAGETGDIATLGTIIRRDRAGK